MKKVYLIATLLGATSFAFSQVGQTVVPSNLIKKGRADMHTKVTPPVTNKATPIVSYDFSDPTKWVIDKDPGTQGNWVIGTNPPNDYDPVGYYPPMESATAANGFAYFDAIQFSIVGNNLTQNAYVVTKDPIDCTGLQNIRITFTQSYRRLAVAIVFVELSTDNGATWTQSTEINQSVANGGEISSKPYSVYFDSQGSSTVKIRFRWNNDVNNAYGWLIDDVAVYEAYANDVETKRTWVGSTISALGLAGDPNPWGLQYFQIPSSQIAPISFSGKVKNVGSLSATGVKLQVTEAAQGYTGVSPAAAAGSLDFLKEDSLVVSSTFTPSGEGTYNINREILNDATDENPSNNQLSDYIFSVGGNVYARDNDTLRNYLSGYRYQTPRDVEPAVFYNIYENTKLEGISFFLGDTVTAGTLIFGKVYNYDNYESTSADWEMAKTISYSADPADKNSWITVKFATPIQLKKDSLYVISVHGSADVLSYGAAQKVNTSTNGLLRMGAMMFHYAATPGWGGVSRIPMIRMILVDTSSNASLMENAMENFKVSEVYPNPFANATTVKYSLKRNVDVSYRVVDLAGNVVAHKTLGNKTKGNHKITINGSSLSDGIYFLNLRLGNATVTRKMVVNK